MKPATLGVVSRVDDIISSGCRGGVKLVLLGGDFSQAFAFEIEPVGVVNEPVQYGVGDCWIADDLVPVFDR